jgi:4-alpha-glucanotransferase
VALPGLTLCTGHHEQAQRILATWARFRDGGLLPNCFPDGSGSPEYNSADAPLWYIEAWRAYLEASNDLVAVARHFPALTDLLARYGQEGRAAIALDPADGLIHAGTAQTQLTWMDARVAGRPVTPRMGKPVELNALWYNALMSLAAVARALQHDAGLLERLAARARAGFQRFVRDAGQGLLDVLDGPAGNDATVRPNQILAVSLTHSPLAAADQASVLQVVAHRLVTSYGLRTLDPAHPDYQGCYAGGVDVRDGAYHQGAAWAWLLGHYALAHYRTTGDATAALSLIEPLRDHLADGGLGTISELFDGDPPHRPRGAPAQAWSVGCTLQAWCRLEAARRATQAEGRAVSRG